MDRRYRPGGSLQLAGLIDAYGEHILADFHQYYGLNLLDLYRPNSGLTVKSVAALIKQLPPDCRTFAAIQGQDMGWSYVEHLLAALIDSVNHNTYVFAQAHQPKGRKLPKPEPFPRPGKKAAKKPSQFAFMARQARAKAVKKE